MLNKSKTTKKDQLVEAARRAIYLQGYNQTTLADVASEAGVPLGNVYYYFRTKEALGEAMVADMAASYRTARAHWDELPDPKQRLLAFIQMTIDNSKMLAQSGCPIGSLCQELHKQGGQLAEKSASLFTEFLAWLETQFQALGRGQEGAGLALHLMSALQGASLLSNSFRSPEYITREAERLKQWIKTL